MNQRIIKRHLEAMGVPADRMAFAADGREAQNMALKGHFHLILMDLQVCIRALIAMMLLL